MQLSRRELLLTSLATACHATCPQWDSDGAGIFEEALPFLDEPWRELGALVGVGLEGRLFTDLSGVGEGSTVIPNDQFYIRTAAPTVPETWSVIVGGLVEASVAIPVDTLIAQAEDQGEVLLECSGNNSTGSYGLMSAARWGGVPLSSVLASVKPLATAAMIKITGYDFTEDIGTSKAGCSWVFSPDDVAEAFLATEMNGAPLPLDHGGPIRLIIPNRYGCTLVKWVTAITYVGSDEVATPQMLEFATRTHQDKVPALARDYIPATIDPCAIPLRVERWTVDGETQYRIIGILWGGPAEVSQLSIAFNERGETPVQILPGSVHTWRIWTCCWQPHMHGPVEFSMRVLDEGVRTRRLDKGMYRRSVEIPKV